MNTWHFKTWHFHDQRPRRRTAAPFLANSWSSFTDFSLQILPEQWKQWKLLQVLIDPQAPDLLRRTLRLRQKLRLLPSQRCELWGVGTKGLEPVVGRAGNGGRGAEGGRTQKSLFFRSRAVMLLSCPLFWQRGSQDANMSPVLLELLPQEGISV